MKLVEYNDSYAAKVADMWNKSNENWGNEDALMTASDVIATESSSGNIKLYIAIDNEEVVGYCSFSEYTHDEGASYLPLLNVRPDYHGKKVGKALILKILEHAIESKWSRFDLFTWSGNLKAMPLYKKCGFFWEKRNSSVHLMNFIPYVYQTEALKVYLNQIDWYKDSKRIIDMNHDGNPKRDFDFYRYDFKNDKTKLSLEFEKTGRGLTYIDTPDYEIEMVIKEPKLIYEEEYEIVFRIKNKTNKQLSIKLNGINNKNIETYLEKEIDVVGSKTIAGKFFIGEIKKNQEKERTHPVVEVNVLINGLLAKFKTGIFPMPPVNLKLNAIEYNQVINREYTCYLDIENNLTQEETFTIELPNDFIKFNETIKIKLAPKQKRSIPVKYTLDSFGLYRKNAKIRYLSKILEKEVYAPFFGNNQSFTGFFDDRAIISSGNYLLEYDTHENRFSYFNSDVENILHNFHTPQLGKPYSLELSQSKPEIIFPDNNSMQVTFKSKSINDVYVILNVINNYGILEVDYELVNSGDERKLSLSIPLWHSLKDMIVPYAGHLLNINEGAYVAAIDHQNIDENWFYNSKRQYGFTWSKDVEPKIVDWKMAFNFEDIKLKRGESFKTPKFYVSFVDPSLKAFRDFTGNKDKKSETHFLEPFINNGNPFTKNNIEVSIRNLRKTQIQGTFSVDGFEADYHKTIITKPGLKTVNVNLQDKSYKFKRLTCEVKNNILLKQNGDDFIVDNGVLQFIASKAYGDGIYSLKFNDKEWLDSNYPKPVSRAWWGKYLGGIVQRIQGLDDIQVLEEKWLIDFVEIADNFGNAWKGIKTNLINTCEGVVKDINIELYCLTLPNVSVVSIFSVFTNNSGKILLKKNLHKFYTLKISEEPKNVKLIDGYKIYHCNNISIDPEVDKLAVFDSDRDYKLCVFSNDSEILVESQPEFLITFTEEKITVPDRMSIKTNQDFIIFTKDKLDKDALKDFANIKFNI